MIAQEKDMMMRTQEKELMRMQAEEAEPIYTIYVDDATGDDKKGDGTDKKPYKTIGRALEVAESRDTIKVGPGVYSESFWINTLDYITLEGSGGGSTTIDGDVWVDYCKKFELSGFTIKGDPGSKVGIWCWNVNWAIVKDCIFDCPHYQAEAIFAERTMMNVYDSQIKTDADGAGVDVGAGSIVGLVRCKIESGIGVYACDGANVALWDCELVNNGWLGIWVQSNASLGIGEVVIDGSVYGIWVDTGAHLKSIGLTPTNEIFNNSAGIYIGPGGQADLGNIYIHDNQIGIKATQASTLNLQGIEPSITSNGIGVEVSEFAHAFLNDFSITGNGLDVHIHTGGQAICNPSKIATLDSDCPFCQK